MQEETPGARTLLQQGFATGGLGRKPFRTTEKVTERLTMSIANDQYVSAFLRVLVTELTCAEVIDAADLVTPEDFGGHWQARTVYEAARMVASKGVEAGHGHQALDPLAVNRYLLETGELTNESLRSYWNELTAPAEWTPPRKHQLRGLAHLVIESHFRQRHAAIYGRDDSHLRPLEDLTTEMNNHREELLAIYARLSKPARPLSVVREGGAA